jgi:lysosomal acid lipase/cholesteryl ester hydrolase
MSSRQLVHFAQIYLSGKFQQFDFHGNNTQIYGTWQPPEYKFSNIVAPLFIYRGPQDLLSSRKDTERAVSLLPNVVRYRVVPNFNHVDFTYGKRTRKILYNDVLNSFESAPKTFNNNYHDDSFERNNYVRSIMFNKWRGFFSPMFKQ